MLIIGEPQKQERDNQPAAFTFTIGEAIETEKEKESSKTARQAKRLLKKISILEFLG